METTTYKVCGNCDRDVDTYRKVSLDIQDKLGLENVYINMDTGEVRYDNPRNCHVDERKLEEAARQPGRDIQFEVCERAREV